MGDFPANQTMFGYRRVQIPVTGEWGSWVSSQWRFAVRCCTGSWWGRSGDTSVMLSWEKKNQNEHSTEMGMAQKWYMKLYEWIHNLFLPNDFLCLRRQILLDWKCSPTSLWMPIASRTTWLHGYFHHFAIPVLMQFYPRFLGFYAIIYPLLLETP